MDDSVIRAMELWPNVPECHGWLSLDRRGNWLLMPGGDSAAAGERISNHKVIDFINRNYLRQDDGQYFFQNGPQRVFVSLAYTPYVVSVGNTQSQPLDLQHHTGQPVEQIDQVWIDSEGSLLLSTNLGVALVDDRDADKLLACTQTPGGKPADDERLADAVTAAMQGGDIALQFCWGEACVAVEALSREALQPLL